MENPIYDEEELFIYEMPYDEPADTEEGLYGQLEMLSYRDISPDDVTLGRELGRGWVLKFPFLYMFCFLMTLL